MRPRRGPGARKSGERIWLGLFVLISLISVLALLLVISEPALLRGSYVITVMLDDASGLRGGDSVRLRGIPVGRVVGFSLAERGVAVRVELSRDYPVPRDSSIHLRQINMLGEMGMDIIAGTSQEILQHNDVILGTRQEDMIGSVDDVADETRLVLQRVRSLLSRGMVENVHQSSEELVQLLAHLNDLVSQLHTLSSTVDTAVQNVAEVTSRPEIETTLENLPDLTGAAGEAARLVEVMLTRLADGEGTLGRMTQDTSLYDNANLTLLDVQQAAQELTMLLRDVRRDPGRYFHWSLF